MKRFAEAPWLTVITGHYGVGKTNLSLNIARDIRAVAPRVTLIDLDIVNPYFRSTDNRDFLDAFDIRILGPVFGASNLDVPSLMPGINEAIFDANAGHAVIIDVGGDPEGARALGRFTAKIATQTYRLVHVVNFNRPETATVEDNIALLQSIEETSGLKATEIIGNTHLKDLSTIANIVSAIKPTQAIAKSAGLPLAAIAVPRSLAEQVMAAFSEDKFSEDMPLAGFTNATEDEIRIYPVDIIVGTPWELDAL